MGVPGSEGLKLASFGNLRGYADLYSVARACIEVRKQEILGIEWDIVLTDEAKTRLRRTATPDPQARERPTTKAAKQLNDPDDFADLRDQLLKFFKRPDPNYENFQSWLSALLEEVLVVDALSLYLHPARMPGKGVMGTDLAAMALLDGTTIRPLLNTYGGKPHPPNPAYQQYLWGVPRVDMMRAILDEDLEQLKEDQQLDEVEPVKEYRGDQLLYLPYCRRAWTPYGFPPVERCLLPISTGLKRQQYLLDYFTEGSIPGVFVSPGPDIVSPEQIRIFQDALNAIAGDAAWKHRIVVLPGGSKAEQMKPLMADQHLDISNMEQTLMAFEVQPNEVGMLPGGRTQGLGGAGQHEQAAKTAERKATKPLLMWLKRTIFDYVIQEVAGLTDAEWSWNVRDEEAEQARAETHKTLISIGELSIDEGRKELGLDPWDLPLTSMPIMVGQGGTPIPLDPESPLNPESQYQDQQELAQQQTDQSQDQVEQGQQQTDLQADQQRHQQQMDRREDARAQQAHQREMSQPPPRPSAQKVAGEFKALQNYLRHGRDAAKFKSEIISKAAALEVQREAGQIGLGKAIEKGRRQLISRQARKQREYRLGPISVWVANQLADLARQYRTEKLSMLHFVDLATDTMREGYQQAYSAGKLDAKYQLKQTLGKQLDSPAVLDEDDLLVIDQATDSQHQYLQNLAKDITAGLATEALAQRIDLYGETSRWFYELGQGQTLKRSGAVSKIIWYTGGAGCERCALRDGVSYDWDSLPGVPGAGGFGSDLCLGGPRCHCHLEYVLE